MLSSRLHELLTAYVDGELSSRQRKAVQRLLQRSSQARALYRKLKGDSRLLRLLPRRRLDQDLSGSVLAVIISQGLERPRHVATAPTLSRFTIAAGLAAAAVVLLAVGAFSYVYFASGYRDSSGQQPLARKGPGSVASPGVVELPAPRPPEREPDVVVDEPAPWPEDPPMPPPIRLAQEPTFYTPLTGPDSPTVPSSIIVRPQDPVAAPSSLAPSFSSAFELPKPPRLILLPLRELDQEPQLLKLQEDLRGDNGFRLELFCRDSARALDRLQRAFKEQGITLRMDGDTQVRLRQRVKSNYALFVENVTPDELARILRKLGQDDQAATARDPREGQFADKSVLKPLIATDRNQLAALLGVDSSKVQPRKPSAGKPAERSALIVSYVARPGIRYASREVRQFLDGRKEVRPGTVQLFLVLQNQNF